MFNSSKYLKIRFEFCEWESAKIFLENFGLLERTKSNNFISIFYFIIELFGDIMKANPSSNAHTHPPIERSLY